MKTNRLRWIVLLTQGIGAVFFAVFWASYAFALPSYNVLHGEPVFRILISIFGGIFILLTTILLALSHNHGRTRLKPD